MKKQLLISVLVCALAGVGMSTFTSCKDNIEDVYAELKDEMDSGLQGQYQLLSQMVDVLEKELATCQDSCKTKWERLQKAYYDLDSIATADFARKDSLEAQKARIDVLEVDYANMLSRVINIEGRLVKLDDLTKRVEVLEGHWNDNGALAADEKIAYVDPVTGDTLEKTMTELVTMISNDITVQFAVAKASIDSLATVTTALNDSIDKLKPEVQKGVDAMAWVNQYGARIQALDSLSILNDSIEALSDALKKHIADSDAKFDDLTTKFNTVYAALGVLQVKVGALTATVMDLAARVDANEVAIDELTTKVDQLFKAVDALNERLNKYVSGIITQATVNPIFGYVNTPFGVKTNIFMTYYGTSNTKVLFPSNSSAAEYNNQLVFTAADIAMLQSVGNFQQFDVNPGDCLMDDSEGNAGTLYVTVNPNTVDFTGATLELVNSQDQASGMTLSPLAKSDKVLTFGLSTRAANNGFYEAKVTLNEADIDKVKVNVEPNLASSFKNALNDLKSRKLSGLAELGYVMGQQLTDILPANGLKAAWTDTVGEHAVYSEYNIAATAIKPLSYKFLLGTTLPTLPTISPISGMSFDPSAFSFNFAAPTIDVSGVTFNFSLSNISITSSSTIQITIDMPQFDNSTTPPTYTGTIPQTFSPDPASMDALFADIENSFNSQIGNWNTQMQTAFEDAIIDLVSEINTQIGTMISSINSEINTKLGDLINNINGELAGALTMANNYIDKYNNVAARLNNYLTDPNQFLQSTMYYRATDGNFYHLSTDRTYPTVFTTSGSGMAGTLFPTSYSGELVAPAFKKFVAVTNVWNAANEDANTNTKCYDLLKTANTAEFMNQAISGNQRRVPFVAPEAGYVYEIVYSALDYSGVTSSRKYYIKVN